MKKVSFILIGIFLSFVCLEFFLQTTSFVISEIIKYKNYKTLKTKFNDNDTITILCVGESTTYEQWPVQLEQYLKENSNKNFNIVSSALPSIGIENLLKRTSKMIEDHTPDIVISMMGVNDAIFEKRKEQIYKKYRLKTLDLFYLIKKHLKSNKLYAIEKQNHNDLYFLEFVDKYKNNSESPIEFLEILEKQPNNMDALTELIFLYFERHDIENFKKYINIFIKKYPDIINNKVFVIALNIYCFDESDNNYNDFNTILIHLIKNKEKTTQKDINEILKNSISLNYKFIKLKELEYIYKILIDNEINATTVIDIYDYLLKNNIKAEYPKYNITFLKDPNFNTKQIKKSYIELAKLLKERNIIYICMGYPTININMFKNIFNETNLKDCIIFVSNEHNFNNYLKNKDYFSVFTDQFAGTFGHCTDLGNTMIAENVGNVILNLTNKKTIYEEKIIKSYKNI